MKKLLFAVVAIALMASVSFAQEEAVKKAEGPVTLMGKIVSVTLADPAKGIASGVVEVTDDVGKTTAVTVESGVKVIDKTLQVVTLDQLKIGDKVAVTASKTAEGKDKAEAINVTE